MSWTITSDVVWPKESSCPIIKHGLIYLIHCGAGLRSIWRIVLDDITERKLTEEALQKSKERFFKIFHKSPSFMLMTAFEDGTIVEVNDAYCQLTGYARQELMGRTAVELGIIDQMDRLEGNRLLEKNGSFQNKEERRWTKAGHERYVLLSAETINLDGQRYIISMGLDITERKLAEDELRQNRNLLAEAENMAGVGAWSWDIQDDVWSFSENWLKIHGCSEPPRTTEDLLPIAHPEDQRKIREAFRNSLAEKTRYDIEHRIVRQDNGEIRHIQGIGDVETNTAGEPVRMFGVSMDVTWQRRNQQALEQARAAAERANRAKSDFLAMMSHEIRTPMNSILGMLRLALSGDLPGKQKERIQVARDSAESLLWLLNDILDLSRVEAGRFTLNEKEFRIRHLLNNICREIEVQASEKNIKHYLSVGQDLPTVLHGDPYRLKRILYNLLSNAIKFTDRGWVSLEAERVDTRPGSENDGFMITTVLFTIKDTGKGIDPDQLESIFDSYYQAVHDSLSPEQGTGLGLAICKNLSKMMGGSIWAESEPGQGSFFYVQLPFKTDGQIMEEPESVNDDASWPDSSPLNILLVEDQKMNQVFTVDLLSSYGHQVTVAENGQEALDTLARSSFDLVLMDIRMPVMDGIETTMRIRSADPLLMNPDIPVIGLSAHTVTDQEMQRFQYAGFSNYVVKPVSFEKLFTAIEEVLKKDHQE